MAEVWRGILLILGIDLLLIVFVSGIVFVASAGSGRRQDRQQARRFAEAVAGGDFEEAETVAREAFQPADKTDLTV